MKLKLYELSQYTDTKLYYITRLRDVSSDGSISRVVVRDGIKSKSRARVILETLEANGLRPIAYTLTGFPFSEHDGDAPICNCDGDNAGHFLTALCE